MNDKDFEKIMDKWVSHEIDSTPDIVPTESIYKKVRAKQKKSTSMIFSRPIRWVTVSIAVSAVILFTVFYPRIFRPTLKAPEISLREGFAAGKIEKSRGRGELQIGAKKGVFQFGQMQFQYQTKDAESIEVIDIQNKKDTRITLTSDDNYRFLFHLNQERFVYVYQLNMKKRLIKLFPNEKFGTMQNPVQPEQIYYLPQMPNWFYLDNGTGQQTIFFVVSAKPGDDLDKLFDQYVKEKNNRKKKNILNKIISVFETIKKTPMEEAKVYEVKFNLQN